MLEININVSQSWNDNTRTYDVVDAEVHVSPRYYSSIDPVEQMKDIIPTEYEFKQGNRLYFMPECNVPRVKMKDLSVNLDVKQSRDLDKSNIIILNDKSLNTLSDYTWKYHVKTEHFKGFISIIADKLDEYYQNKLSVLDFYTEEHVLIEYNTYRLMNSHEYDFSKEFNALTNNKFEDDTESKIAYYINDNVKMYDIFNDYTKGILKHTLVNEKAIIAQLNNDNAVTIDNQLYSQLCQMFNSSDEDNHVLAMEIMANSNYYESILYLEILFNKYHNRIWNSPTKNHVNFKSLCSYLDKGRYNNTTFDSILDTLYRHGQLVKEKVDTLVSELFYSDVNHLSSSYVKATQIMFTEDFYNKVGAQYVNNVSLVDDTNMIAGFEADDTSVDDELIQEMTEDLELIEKADESVETPEDPEFELSISDEKVITDNTLNEENEDLVTEINPEEPIIENLNDVVEVIVNKEETKKEEDNGDDFDWF